MHSDSIFVAGLSLTTVGNLATPDIARDLMMEVDRHLTGGQPYLVKKVIFRTSFFFLLFCFQSRAGHGQGKISRGRLFGCACSRNILHPSLTLSLPEAYRETSGKRGAQGSQSKV